MVTRSRRSSDTDSRSGGPILEVLLIFVVVLIAQTVAAVISAGLMAGLFVLGPPLTANPWTIVTSVYAHSGLGHLLSNSVGLVLFGWPIARATTRLRFHTFFLVTGALAGITQVVTSSFFASIGVGDPTAVLGASGAVFALAGYLIAGNRLSDAFASVVEIPRWAAVAVFVVLAAVITIATGAPGVALIAHFTGFLLGLLAGRAGVLDVASRRARADASV
ncbi:rhomboid family intramembrane serine protease [Natronococcus sp. A-GB7]|uniref:rhomboid family intramembrane serine protease n=1 Tax=Natronococcus sp. A-GB7 TaxID=3037649 RepID=UPI00241DE421|nr:rhomboid family intramembrane serine protease [Natronococcus sp. A-GB7]MDG5819196.1 rhomboid family intramembrane serine protease [Natronococcus sp. A-GB7]